MVRSRPRSARTVAADPVEDAADRLYGLPLEDFTRERDANARELRKAGEKEAAARVAKLPKPSQVAGVVNRLAREGRLATLLEAGAALREAQLGGGEPDQLRRAVAAERTAVDELVREAGRGMSRALADRLRETLHAAAGDEELRELMAAGRLVKEPEGGGAWPAADLASALETSTARVRERKSRPSRQDRERQDRERQERAERREREAAERREREEARRREKAERRELERRLRTARAEAESARKALERAQRAYESAQDEVARLEERLA
jgi:chromosome segregation ATPase